MEKKLKMAGVIVAALIYLVFPIVFVPDFIPGLSPIDDIIVMILGGKKFASIAGSKE